MATRAVSRTSGLCASTPVNTFPTGNGAAASVVVGKPDFTSTEVGTSASVTGGCFGVAFSPDGNKLIIADVSNNRVLIYNSIPTRNGANADVVIGQTDFTSNASGTSETELFSPTGWLAQTRKLRMNNFWWGMT